MDRLARSELTATVGYRQADPAASMRVNRDSVMGFLHWKRAQARGMNTRVPRW
jgi:hypothetical protein